MSTNIIKYKFLSQDPRLGGGGNNPVISFGLFITDIASINIENSFQRQVTV